MDKEKINYSIGNKGRNVVIIVLVAIYISICVFSVYMTKPIIGKNYPGFLVLKNNLVNLMWLSEWEGPKAGVKARDIVEEIDGEPVANAKKLYKIVRGVTPGTPLEYTILRSGARLKIKVPVSVFTLRDYIICFSSWTVSGIFFFVLALVVFYIKPKSPAALALLFSGTVVGYITASTFEYCTTNWNHLNLYLFPLAGPSILILGFNFPEVLKGRKYAIMFTAATAIPLIIFYRYWSNDVYKFIKIDTVFNIYHMLTSGAGLGLMIYSFVGSKDPLTRQKAKIVVYGLVISFMIASATLIGALVLKKISFYWMALTMFVIPGSFGYAIVKHNLFDVDYFIRRTAGYLIVSAFLVGIFFVSVFAFSIMLQKVSGQSSQIAAVVATILIITAFRPLQWRTDQYLDRHFFREKYEYRKTIRQASKLLMSMIELDELLRRMLRTILDSMKIEGGVVLLRDKESDKFYLAENVIYTDGEGPSIGGPRYLRTSQDLFEPDHPAYEYLASNQRPVQLNEVEELELNGLSGKRGLFLEFMEKLEVVILFPIIYENRLTGVVGLGPKLSGAWYSSEDIDILQTLIMQISISIENARKVEELKRMVELETSYRELQQINDMKDNFIAMVSHDLRTPMTCIKGYASLMSRHPDRIDSDLMSQYSEIIVDESDRLTRLITDILDLQKFEAGRMELDFDEINIEELVDESINTFKSAADIKKLKLQKYVPARDATISGHRDRLSQVMANLLSNAIKFTPDGGKVETKVEMIENNGKKCVRISISDTGIGIPFDMEDKLFQKFHQAENLVRNDQEGSGLGLALVREIIEYHGGAVGYQKNTGAGSTFYFEMDAAG